MENDGLMSDRGDERDIDTRIYKQKDRSYLLQGCPGI